jgi:hypothetical protein
MDRDQEQPRKLKFTRMSDVVPREYPQSRPAPATPGEVAIWQAVVNAVASPPEEFVDLATAEPRLWELASQAVAIKAQQRKGGKQYCTNADWFADFKPALCRLVGWSRKQHPQLGTEQAYATAYDTIHELLPGCKHQGLCRWRPSQNNFTKGVTS